MIAYLSLVELKNPWKLVFPQVWIAQRPPFNILFSCVCCCTLHTLTTWDAQSSCVHCSYNPLPYSSVTSPYSLQDAISKVIGEVDDLDFSRYGDTLFEVIFTGHALQPGSVVPLEDASDQPWNVLACGKFHLLSLIRQVRFHFTFQWPSAAF